MHLLTQPLPFAMQIELVEGCNLRCSYCGLNGIRGVDNNYKYMAVSLAERLCSLLLEEGWTPRIEFAMHGEPSLHPNMLTILHEFRHRLGPKIHLMMTSNGAGFLKNTTRIDLALRYLNVLALDAYENVQIVPKILERYNGQHQPKHYPADKAANPHQRRKPGQHDLVIVQDIMQASTGTHASINNHCGCGAPPNERAQGKRCAKPFRELSVRWDGNVALCCNDWRGYFKVGNLNTHTLQQVWQHPAMVAARKHLYHGLRTFTPCQGCDALSYRPGLLPDQLGKYSMPLPDTRDVLTVRKAAGYTKSLGRSTYALPVLRAWEVGTKENPT